MSRRRARRGASRRRAPAKALYGRRLMPAGRALVVILVALLVWTVLYAPTMKRAADASPIGIRRTISLAVLTPIAAVSDWIGLDELAGTIERAVGRDPGKPGGAFVPPPEDIPVAPDEPDDPDGERQRGRRRGRGGADPSARRPTGSSASRSSGTPSPPVSASSPSGCSGRGSSGFRARAGSPRGWRDPTTSTGRTRCAGSSIGSTPTS